MNNKGFGVIYVLIFAVFAIMAIFVFYSFITSLMSFGNEKHIYNYKNEYSIYNENDFNNNTNSYIKPVNNYKSYSEMEVYISDVTKKYINDFYSNIEINDTLYVKIETLQSHAYLNVLRDLTKNSHTCSGYTKVSNVGGNLIYKSYVKCGPYYTTDNYNYFEN